MSKTKNEKARAAPGIEKMVCRRHRLCKETTEYNSFEAFNDAVVPKSMRQSGVPIKLGGLAGVDRARALAADARRRLEKRGLPGDAVVFYDPDNPRQRMSEAEYDARERKLPKGWALLDKYMRELGYGDFDDETMLARVVVLADRVCKKGSPIDHRLEAAYRMGMTVQQLCYLWAEDKSRTKPRKPRRKAWVEALAGELIRTRPESTNKEIWEDIPEEMGGLAVHDDVQILHVWREARRLWAAPQADESSGHERGPGFRTFCDDYLRAARNRSRK